MQPIALCSLHIESDTMQHTRLDTMPCPIARGLELRAAHVEHADITPCAFEHSALIAAWGAPERATVLARTGDPPGPACPSVTIR